MLYQAIIRNIYSDWYDGSICLEVNGYTFACYYQAPFEFSEKYLIVGKQIDVDLWLGCVSRIERMICPSSYFSLDAKATDGIVCGNVISTQASGEFCLDCGILLINVKVDRTAAFQCGMSLMVSGSKQVFFPNTEWSYDKVGCI